MVVWLKPCKSRSSPGASTKPPQPTLRGLFLCSLAVVVPAVVIRRKSGPIFRGRRFARRIAPRANRRAALVWLAADSRARARLSLATSHNRRGDLASAAALAIFAGVGTTRRARSRSCSRQTTGSSRWLHSVRSATCSSLTTTSSPRWTRQPRRSASPCRPRATPRSRTDSLERVESWRGRPIAGRVHYAADAPSNAADRLLFMNRDGHLASDASPLTPD
jgi:hypothetical protein